MEEVLRARLPCEMVRLVKKFIGPKSSPPASPPPSHYMSDRCKQIQKIRHSPKLTAMAFYLLDDDDIDI
jgi:hypothetical protein